MSDEESSFPNEQMRYVSNDGQYVECVLYLLHLFYDKKDLKII